MWWRRITPVRGSTDRLPEGNTYCQSPLTARVGILAGQRVGKRDFAETLAKVAFLQPLHPRQIVAQRLHQTVRQHRYPVLRPLAIPDEHLAVVEVDVLDPQSQCFQHPQSRAVEQPGDQPLDPGELGEQRLDLLLGQHDRQPDRLLGTGQPIEPGQIGLEHLPIEEKQGGKRLVLGCSRDVAVDREMVQKPGDLDFPEGCRVPLAREQDEAAHPMNIRLLGAVAIMLVANGLAKLRQQPGLAFGIGGCGNPTWRLLDGLTPILARYVIMYTVLNGNRLIARTDCRITDSVTQLNASLRTYTSR